MPKWQEWNQPAFDGFLDVLLKYFLVMSNWYEAVLEQSLLKEKSYQFSSV